jgi:hypothetical protein
VNEEIKNGAASARTSNPGASIGHLPCHTIRVSKRISRLIVLQSMLRSHFPCCEHFFHVANRDASNIQRVHVACMLRVRCVQHPTSEVFLPPPPMLRPCCDYIVTMLRPCCVQHSTLGALLPSSSTQNLTSHVCNIENSTSATLKFNVCNTQQHMFATLRLSICSVEN